MGVYRSQVRTKVAPIEAWFVLIVSKKEFVNDGRFVECLTYVHFQFFSDLEVAMGELVEALISDEEKCE